MATKKDDNDEFVAPFTIAMETKPIKVLESLFIALLPRGKKIELSRSTTYTLNNENDGMGVILLQKGLLTACTQPSNTVLQTFFPPTMIGMIDNYRHFYNAPGLQAENVYFAETDVTFFFVSLESFVSVMDEQNLWHDIARLLAHRLLVLSSKLQVNINADSYEVIRNLILELWDYPEEYRVQISLPHFIRRRTGISRSRIMKILQDLKIGGYIQIQQGKLLSVSRLPVSY